MKAMVLKALCNLEENPVPLTLMELPVPSVAQRTGNLGESFSLRGLPYRAG